MANQFSEMISKTGRAGQYTTNGIYMLVGIGSLLLGRVALDLGEILGLDRRTPKNERLHFRDFLPEIK
jgi:hypothetical protein